MKPIPFVVLKFAMTLDGYIDDASDKRLIISNEKDFAEVEKVRESCDAILVGAETIRKDNPRLVLKSGKKLTKVTISHSGNLNPESNFFTKGDSEKLVYTTDALAKQLQQTLTNATVISLGQTINLHSLLGDLFKRGVKRLLVEGGSTIITEFINGSLVDELQISIAGMILGQQNAPRFIKPGQIHKQIPLQFQSLSVLDDIVVITYKLENQKDKQWINYAINLSKNSPLSDTAFTVGAALVDKEGNLIADGYSRETDPTIHAEEVVLQKITDKYFDLSQATLYTSLEPCNQRLSQKECCVDLILKSEIKRIVFAAKEPPIFVSGEGAERLKKEGKEIINLSQFENEVISVQSPAIQQKWQNSLSAI